MSVVMSVEDEREYAYIQLTLAARRFRERFPGVTVDTVKKYDNRRNIPGAFVMVYVPKLLEVKFTVQLGTWGDEDRAVPVIEIGYDECVCKGALVNLKKYSIVRLNNDPVSTMAAFMEKYFIKIRNAAYQADEIVKNLDGSVKQFVLAMLS